MSGLETPSGEWYLLGRDTIRSYVEFSSDAERMGNLADVFPLIFFLVAALSSLTSMTRMVEDHRAEIGTMKALGFSTASISIKYIGYALAASLVGGGTGLLIGCTALPSLIYYEWGILYLLPKLEMSISPVVVLYSLGAAVLATAGAAFTACYTTLLAKPAELLRPRAPKPGKRIFLEYIGPVWRRLTFIQKVSARNLFRYKKRFWMTIIGIAGCTALLATGFGLRDSIFDVLTWQFDDLMPYNATISIDAGLNPSDRAEMMEALDRLNAGRAVLRSRSDEHDAALRQVSLCRDELRQSPFGNQDPEQLEKQVRTDLERIRELSQPRKGSRVLLPMVLCFLLAAALAASVAVAAPVAAGGNAVERIVEAPPGWSGFRRTGPFPPWVPSPPPPPTCVTRQGGSTGAKRSGIRAGNWPGLPSSG